MPNGPVFQVALNFDVIQSIRLLHVLLESHGDVRVYPLDLPKLRKLKEVFGLEISDDVENAPILPGIETDHEETPTTRIGQITRPLLFAHGMVEKCRSFWSADRTIRACFSGRLHRERRLVLQQWVRRQFPDATVDLPSQSAVDRRVRFQNALQKYARRILRGPLRRFQKYVRIPPVERRTTIRDIVFETSDRGWRHPTKAWDASYFQRLANSKFVLCPDGKFVWTYRFFEAVLCGAIPVIQNWCPLYDGFRYHTMEDPVEALDWNRADALHNFNLCRKRLTVSLDRLNAEVCRLHRRASSNP